MFLAGARATGSKDANGVVHGGIYYPAHMKNGAQVSGRWEGNVALNSRDWTDDAGQKHEGRRVYVRLVAWNSKNSAPGKGLADIMAKHVSVGKELSCAVRAESFDKRIFVNGQPLLDAAGQPITYPAIVFRITGDLTFGNDSSKLVAAEVSRYNGAMTFDSRPASWNVPGTPDNEAWKQIIAARSALVYDGKANTYGYARVIIPAGATTGNPMMPNQMAAQAQEGLTMPNQMAGQEGLTMPAGGTSPAEAGQTLQNQLGGQGNSGMLL
jgi:hypothetical protein